MIPFRAVHEALLAQHGPQNWWPAVEPFEIIVGALLVQRTTWTSTAKAIAELKQRGLLDATKLVSAETKSIEDCIKGAGFFRTKARRLQSLSNAIAAAGGIDSLDRMTTVSLRNWFLAQEGIGAETADAVVLYAFGRAAVVIDAYLRRLAQRLLALEQVPMDAKLRQAVAAEIKSVATLNEFHALVVAHGKQPCGMRPVCEQCGLRGLCRTGAAA